MTNPFSTLHHLELKNKQCPACLIWLAKPTKGKNFPGWVKIRRNFLKKCLYSHKDLLFALQLKLSWVGSVHHHLYTAAFRHRHLSSSVQLNDKVPLGWTVCHTSRYTYLIYAFSIYLLYRMLLAIRYRKPETNETYFFKGRRRKSSLICAYYLLCLFPVFLNHWSYWKQDNKSEGNHWLEQKPHISGTFQKKGKNVLKI